MKKIHMVRNGSAGQRNAMKKCNEEMPKIYNKPVEKIQKFSEPDELTEEDM